MNNSFTYKFIFLCSILFLFVTKINGQGNCAEDDFRKDSILFRQLAIDTMICPMMDFNEAYDTYIFLKRQKQRSLERRKRVPSSWMDVDVNRDNVDTFWGDGIASQNERLFGNQMQTKMWKSYKKMWLKAYEGKHAAHYDESKEKEQLISRLVLFSQKAKYKPLFFKTIAEKYRNSITDYVEDLYEKSMLNNRRSLKRFLKRPSLRRLESDLGGEMTLSLIMYNLWLNNHRKISIENMGKFVCQ